jgi:glycosyltransferase involved in cell wall biosynthesis
MASAAPGSRTRLLFVINDLSRAGAEGQLVALALSLDPARYQVRIALLKHENHFAAELAARGVPVAALRRRGYWDLGLDLRLLRLVRDFRPDVLHSFLFLANLHAALVGRLARVPAVVVSQRSSNSSNLSPFWRRVARRSQRLADRLILNSQALRAEEEAAGFPPERIVVVPNGVARRETTALDRTALGLPAGPLVLSIGRLEERKGQGYLIEAWAAVHRREPSARLVLLGDGPTRPELERKARELGLQDCVRLGGFQARVAEYLDAGDALVHPSLTEGMPNVVLEAMAAGKPVVATRVGGIPELVADGESGLLVAPRDPAALADALIRLIREPGLAAELGRNARCRARERFSVGAMVEATEAVYRSLLETRAAV